MAMVMLASFSFVGAQTGYYMVPHLYGPGNPGGYNTDDEYPVGGGQVAGWANLMTGPHATPQWTGAQNIPFLFKFNNTSVFQYKVSSSGVLTFDINAATAPAYGNITLPSASVPDQSVVVSGMYAPGANDVISTKTFGPAGRQQHYIQFSSYSPNGQSGCYVYWAIVLEEGTNNIYIVDQRFACNGSATFSIGLQINATTAVGPAAPVEALAGTDAGAATNNYYAFIPGLRPDNGVKMATLDMQGFAYIGASTSVSGRAVNVGSNTVNSATLNYKVGNAATVSTPLTGLNMATNVMQTTTHPTAWTPATAGTYNVKMWLSNINGGSTTSDTVSKDIAVISSVIDNLVVFEHFTNASCGPCAAQNPAFTAVLNNNKTKATSVKYHVSWPGVDPMYSFNTTDPTTRVNYYNVTGVPSVRLGANANMGPTGVTQSVIDQHYNNMLKAWDYNLTTYFTGNTLTVTGNVVANTNLSQNDHVLHVAIVEDPVEYASPPGTNGETVFPSTVRKLLPNASGTNIYSDGTPFVIHLQENLSPVIKKENVFVVVWVQSAGSKIAYKGAKIKAGASIGTSTPVLDANNNRSKVYPNPVSEQIRFDFDINQATQAKAVIKNTLGQEVRTIELGLLEAGSQQHTADLSDLSQGMYFIQLQLGKEVHIHRVVKQ